MRERRDNEEETCGKEETSDLSKLEQFGGEREKMREREKEKKRKRKKGGVRSSTLSLDSTEIGPSVFVEARGKFLLRDKSFTWVRESGVFAKLREVGVSLMPWLLLV